MGGTVDIEDVIDESMGLLQDSWSILKPTFGDMHQLTVIGWSGKNAKGEKFYIVKCSECCKDSQVFGEGYFRSRKPDLKTCIPCGCSKSPKLTKEQHLILCTRAAAKLGHTFVGFAGDWCGVSKTKTKLICGIHGQWETTTVGSLYAGRSCKRCANNDLSVIKRKADHEMTTSFLASGAFHPETEFTRTTKKSKTGDLEWSITCPVCGATWKSVAYNLQNGKIGCDCSPYRPKECYINMVKDTPDIIAIKFGVSKMSKRRAKQQNSKSVFLIENYAVYKFPDVDSCKSAENECLLELECGVISQRDMPDGYTETTWVYNLDKIQAIYEKHGGIRYE